VYKKDKCFNNRNSTKAGVLLVSQDKVLLTQSYNNYWGIPKGSLELVDKTSTKKCAKRELKEETGLSAMIKFWGWVNGCAVYKAVKPTCDESTFSETLDATGIGWFRTECAFDLKLNAITKFVLTKSFS
jgi:8-oxo-dGTP pyrophosphatase MutT (NUDIX family)